MLNGAQLFFGLIQRRYFIKGLLNAHWPVSARWRAD